MVVGQLTVSAATVDALVASDVIFVIVQIDCRSVSLLVAEHITEEEIVKSSLYAASLGLISPHGNSIIN